MRSHSFFVLPYIHKQVIYRKIWNHTSGYRDCFLEIESEKRTDCTTGGQYDVSGSKQRDLWYGKDRERKLYVVRRLCEGSGDRYLGAAVYHQGILRDLPAARQAGGRQTESSGTERL